MINSGKNQLALLISTADPNEILKEVKKSFLYFYRIQSFEIIENAFFHICALFKGTLKGYRGCNTDYHDLNHTLDAFLAVSRLLDGRNIYKKNCYDEKKTVNLLLAALLHDTGYIQEDSDTIGTGAKYTRIHVKRSIEFTEKNARIFQLKKIDLEEISFFIACTGLQPDYINLKSGDDFDGAAIISTADLIGQMSDRAYLEKLLFLYYEFSEAGMEGFDTAFDVLEKTLAFYESTMEYLTVTLKKCYDYVSFHFKERYKINENLYITAMEKQMDYLKQIINDDSTNFRNKLKRLNVEEAEERYRSH